MFLDKRSTTICRDPVSSPDVHVPKGKTSYLGALRLWGVAAVSAVAITVAASAPAASAAPEAVVAAARCRRSGRGS